MTDNTELVAQTSITKEEIFQILLDWENLDRSGGCISYEEASSKSAEDKSRESADYFWEQLQLLKTNK